MSDCWQELDVAVARWRIGALSVEDIPAAAMAALTAGCDVPSLALLVAMDGSGWSEVEPVVARVFAERERSLPTNDEAVKLVADTLIRELVAGELDPRDATERLRVLAWKFENEASWQDMNVFVGLADAWERVEAGELERAEVIEFALEKASKILARGGVRLT